MLKLREAGKKRHAVAEPRQLTQADRHNALSHCIHGD